MLTDISRLLANCPELVGVLCVRFVSAGDHLNLKRSSGAFVSARKIPFPGNGDVFAETRFECGSLSRKAKHLVNLRAAPTYNGA